MESVEKKKRRIPVKWERLILLFVCAAALTVVLLLTRQATQPEPGTAAPSVDTSVTLFEYPAQQVTGMTIQRSGEAPWTVEIDEESGCFRLTGEEGAPLTAAMTLQLQQAAAIITVEQVVSSDPAEYTPHLADYGLAEPRESAVLRFADGTERTLYIGSRAPHTAAWYYMRMEGDDRLFALSTGMVEALLVSRESLREVTQPTLHKARIDRITLTNGDGSLHAQWTLQCAIDAADASERWQITAPFAYPADASSMQNLLSNAANLRLGAHVAPATPENLSLYGFDEPRMTIELHMAPGAIATPGEDGALAVTDWPESTVAFVIGGARSDMVDYVRCGEDIYVCSHFTMGVFMDIDPASTMNRYPVLTALGNLASLFIEANGETTAYVLTRTEQVAPNNDLVYDEEGNLLWDVTVTRNGEAFDYAAFEAAYLRLTTVAVAGTIPADDAVDASPHTIYTFTDVDGSVHTVALTSYGVLHDAVSVDGHQAFYIEKNRFQLGLE